MRGVRRDETLDLGPSATPVLDGLARRLREYSEDLTVQPAGPGQWTAFYRGKHLVALARPSPAGDGSVDVAAPAIPWATTLRGRADVEDEDISAKLRAAIERAPEASSRNAVDMTPGGIGGIGTLLTLAYLITSFISWVIRTRSERALAAATGTQGELAILNAARREANWRSNSLALGCLGGILVGFASFMVTIFVGAWLASIGLTPVAAALWLVPLAAAVLVFWGFRRRFPSAPQTRGERWVGRALGFGLAALVAVLALAALASRP